ncbi:MAG: ABC transporter ATP-binding protein [Rhodospirillaceae bacterium]
MLNIAALSAGPGQASVLFDLSLAVAPGEGLALLGRNGAGKSTLLKTIAGLLSARSGSIHFDGKDITALAPQDRAGLGLGYVPEDRRIFTSLTVAENIRVGREAKPKQQPAAHRGPEWDDKALLSLFPALEPLWSRPAGRLSGGEQQMVTVARTLAGAPRLLLLDEPSEGLAPLVVETLAKALATIRQSGLAMILSEQNMGFAQHVSDRAIVLDSGHLVMEGAMADIAGDETALAKHLAV